MASEQEGGDEGREPILNAPWPAVMAGVVIVGSFMLQRASLGDELAVQAFGFSSSDLAQGRWPRLFSMMFVHAGWVHALMNGVAALTFGAPVARLLGSDARGATVFVGFYLACGVLASLGYAVFHPGAAEPVVGASGAVSGLMGAATRLYGREQGLSPVFSQPVLSLGGGWVLANLILAITGAAPLMEGARIAWEAHIAGLLAGLVLIGPFWRLAGKSSRGIDP